MRERPEGVTLPSSVPLLAYASLDAQGRPVGFPTPTRRLEVYSEHLLRHGYDPVPALQEEPVPPCDPRYPLRLSCAKSVVYCHSQHRNLASLRRLLPDPMLEMPPEVAAERGIANNDWVRISTAAGTFVARCRIVRDLEPQSVFAQHGWWVEGPDGSPYDGRHVMAANFNTSIDTTQADPVSGSIPLRCSACEVERIG